MRNKIVIGLTLTVASVVALQTLTASAAWGMLHTMPTASGCACNVAQTFRFDIRPEGLSYMLWGLAGLFAAGWLIGLVYFFATIIKTRRFIKRHPCGVFTFGLLKPQISVCQHCADNLSAAELQAMMAHEKHHVYRHDPLKFLVLDTLRWALFYVPLISTLVKLYHTAVEVEADEQVADREALGGALFSMASAVFSPPSGGMPPLGGETIAVANFATVISERIERLVNPHWSLRFKLSSAQIMLSVFFMAGIFGILNLPQKAPVQTGACMRVPTPCVMPAPLFDRESAVQYTISL